MLVYASNASKRACWIKNKETKQNKDTVGHKKNHGSSSGIVNRKYSTMKMLAIRPTRATLGPREGQNSSFDVALVEKRKTSLYMYVAL